MKISDSFTVPASPEKVWAFLLDFDRSARCMPGVVDFQIAEDRTFEGTLEVRVGPIAARFKGKGKIEEEVEPRRLKATASGRDQRTGTSVQASFTSNLEKAGEGTRVAYEMDVQIRGRLAQFGQGIVQATVSQLTEEFVACLKGQLSGQGGQEAPHPGRSLGRVIVDSAARGLKGSGQRED